MAVAHPYCVNGLQATVLLLVPYETSKEDVVVRTRLMQHLRCTALSRT